MGSRAIRYSSFFFIIKGKGEDAVQLFKEMNTFVAVKGEDHLTVTPGPELVAAGILGADVTVVIDFAVNRQYLLPVG